MWFYHTVPDKLLALYSFNRCQNWGNMRIKSKGTSWIIHSSSVLVMKKLEPRDQMPCSRSLCELLTITELWLWSAGPGPSPPPTYFWAVLTTQCKTDRQIERSILTQAELWSGRAGFCGPSLTASSCCINSLLLEARLVVSSTPLFPTNFLLSNRKLSFS